MGNVASIQPLLLAGYKICGRVETVILLNTAFQQLRPRGAKGKCEQAAPYADPERTGNNQALT